MMNTARRIEQLAQRLQSRTDRHGEPLPGYKENVAAIRAEMAQLQETLGVNDDGK